jgi:hypothetical protein
MLHGACYRDDQNSRKYHVGHFYGHLSCPTVTDLKFTIELDRLYSLGQSYKLMNHRWVICACKGQEVVHMEISPGFYWMFFEGCHISGVLTEKSKDS